MTTLIAPSRDTFRDAYKKYTGVELSDSFIGHFFRMVGMIGKSSIKTNNVVISWDGQTVNLQKRIYN